MTPAYNPKSNAVERSHRDLNSVLRAIAPPGKDWDLYLKKATFTINSSKHSATGFSPFFTLFGYEPISPLKLRLGTEVRNKSTPENYRVSIQTENQKRQEQVRTNMELSRVKNEKQYSQTNMVQFNIGDLVYLYSPNVSKDITPKLASRWTGPWIITERRSPLNYILKPQGNWYSGRLVTVIANVDRIKKWQRLHPTVGQSTTELHDMTQAHDQTQFPERINQSSSVHNRIRCLSGK